MSANAKDPVLPVIRTQKLELVGPKGNVMATLTAGDSTVSLAMNDASQKGRVKIELDDKGSHILLSSADGTRETYLFLKDDGTTGVVAGKNPENPNQHPYVEILLKADGSIESNLPSEKK